MPRLTAWCRVGDSRKMAFGPMCTDAVSTDVRVALDREDDAHAAVGHALWKQRDFHGSVCDVKAEFH